MAHNKKRNLSFRRKSDSELRDIAKSGSLGSACASYVLSERARKPAKRLAIEAGMSAYLSVAHAVEERAI